MPPRLCADRGRLVQTKAPLPPVPVRLKRLQDGFAALGWRLDPFQDDYHLLQCWGATRMLKNLDEAEQLLALMEAG